MRRLHLITFLLLALAACSAEEPCGAPTPFPAPEPAPGEAIDLSHWKLTLPTDRDNDGVADELDPDELKAALAKDALRPYLYWEEDGALNFFVEPAGGTTPNSDYPRTELREQIVPGNDYINWSLDEGGTLTARLQVLMVSEAEGGKTHRLSLAQIHAKDGPPFFKLVWQNGILRAEFKKLVSDNTDHEDPESWEDAEPLYFENPVGYKPFTLRIHATRERVEVQVNDEVRVFEHEDLEKWPFENYFKAGTYLFTSEEDAYASARFYELEVKHP